MNRTAMAFVLAVSLLVAACGDPSGRKGSDLQRREVGSVSDDQTSFGRDHAGRDPVVLPTILGAGTTDFTAAESILSENSLAVGSGSRFGTDLSGVEVSWRQPVGDEESPSTFAAGAAYVDRGEEEALRGVSIGGDSEPATVHISTSPSFNRVLADAHGREYLAMLINSSVWIDRRIASDVLAGTAVAINDEGVIGTRNMTRTLDLNTGMLSLELSGGAGTTGGPIQVLRGSMVVNVLEVLRTTDGSSLLVHDPGLHLAANVDHATVVDHLTGFGFSIVAADAMASTGRQRTLPFTDAEGHTLDRPVSAFGTD